MYFHIFLPNSVASLLEEQVCVARDSTVCSSCLSIQSDITHLKRISIVFYLFAFVPQGSVKRGSNLPASLLKLPCDRKTPFDFP